MKCQAITQYIKPSLNKSKVQKAKSYKLYLKSQKPIMQNQSNSEEEEKKSNRLDSPHSEFSNQMRSDDLDRRKLKSGNQQWWRERMRKAESKS